MEKFEEREPVLLYNFGQKIFGVIHTPLTDKPCPAILLCHGFAGNKCGRNRMYVILAKHLSMAGIATLRLDFRGCGDSEGDLTEMTIEGEVSDALLGLDFLVKYPNIDPKRIGILGRSLGGAIAVIAANRYKKIKSMALWAPVFHAEPWKEDWKRAQAKMANNVSLDSAIRINGQPAGKEFVHQIFNMHLDKEMKELDHIPLLHIHGEKDTMVRIEHADHFLQARNDKKALTRFVRLPHGDHDFTLVEEQRNAINETCQWFKDTL